MIMQFHYDQAQIDLAEVVFKKLDLPAKRVSSSLAVLDGKFFSTSFFQPSTLFALSQVDSLESDPKRQKTSGTNEIGKRKSFNCTQLDQLACISPITSTIQLKSPTDDLMCKDFLLSSGN